MAVYQNIVWFGAVDLVVNAVDGARGRLRQIWI